jgi:hypothetical protein
MLDLHALRPRTDAVNQHNKMLQKFWALQQLHGAQQND